MNFYDTNAILELCSNLSDYGEFCISSVTLHEIEHIKVSRNKDDTTKWRARTAIRWLSDNQDKYEVVIYNDDIAKILSDYKLEDSPDNEICACAKYKSMDTDIIFVSADICCRVIAKNVFWLRVSDIPITKENIYTGYRILEGNTSYINDYISQFNSFGWNHNEYLIIKNTDDNTEKEMRFDGANLVPLKLPPQKFLKAKNSLQRCAIDILMNPDITVAAILGGYGSGKTWLSMRMALYAVNEKGYQSKILGVREPMGEGTECGYLPGSLEDKTGGFFLPLAQQLDGGEFELESLKQRGVLDANIPFYMKGTTYNDTIILVDEAEDLTEKQVRLIGTRLGVNSRIILAGDYKQSVVNSSEHNALIRMCNEFKGDPKFGCIYLGEDVRSSTSKMFADLFKNK